MFFEAQTRSFVQLISLQTPSSAVGFMIINQERLACMLIYVRKIVKLLGVFQNAAVSVGGTIPKSVILMARESYFSHVWVKKFSIISYAWVNPKFLQSNLATLVNVQRLHDNDIWCTSCSSTLPYQNVSLTAESKHLRFSMVQ